MSDYDFNDNQPPRPARGFGGVAENAFDDSGGDTSRYLLVPDDEFSRPYLAIPQTRRAFIWPLGTEGFTLEDQAELGKHKYLGEIELDVDVTHRAETNITLSGVFPGWSSVENMNALRSIFYADTPERGKILHLPGILPNLQYVVCDSETFSHGEDDRTQDLSYTIRFVKVGTGPTANVSAPVQPDQGQGGVDKGRGTRIFRVTATVNTLRKIARRVYSSDTRWTDLYALKKNADWFTKNGIASHRIPDYALPLGHTIWY